MARETELRQDARLDACRKARLRPALKDGRLFLKGARKLANALGITAQELAYDVERALLREDAALQAQATSTLRTKVGKAVA
jgi:hypothetical protein